MGDSEWRDWEVDVADADGQLTHLLEMASLLCQFLRATTNSSLRVICRSSALR